MGPAAATSFDVSFWFLERARAADSYLQPRKLQCLLFLAQGHFAAAYGGRRLMPSVFIFDASGPVDPNIYRAFEHGRPSVTLTRIDETVLVFLDAIWRRYGGSETAVLHEIITEYGAGEAAVREAGGAEVDLAAMSRMFGEASPARRQRPQLMRSHTGRPVTVQKWIPGQKPAA